MAMKKLRVRNHKVVLNRSKGGDAGITVMLFILGLVMFLPMWYLVITALKPLGERNITPPLLYVMKPTFQNFIDLFSNMNSTWVPRPSDVSFSVLLPLTRCPRSSSPEELRSSR